MAQPAGTQYMIFRPNIWVAQLDANLPKFSSGFGANWASPTIGDAKWKKVEHTEEGAVVTPSAPQDDITSDEAGGAFGTVAAGGSEITIGFTPLTPDIDLFTWLSALQEEQSVAADALTSMPAFKRYALSAEGKQFMVGIEGEFQEGSLTNGGGFVRAFGYKVIQTEDTEINMRRTGEDAVVRLGASLRCLATTLDPEQYADTGITEVDKRFDFFVVPAVVV